MTNVQLLKESFETILQTCALLTIAPHTKPIHESLECMIELCDLIDEHLNSLNEEEQTELEDWFSANTQENSLTKSESDSDYYDEYYGRK